MNRLSALFLMVVVVIPTLRADYMPRDEAIKLLREVSAKNYPKHHEVDIINTRIRLDKRCLGVTVNETYRRILTEKGREEDFVYFPFNTHYSTVRVEAIELIKKDGTVMVFAPQEILEEKDNTFQTTGMNIYSNLFKILIGKIPDVKVGDIIYTREHITRKKAHFKNNFSADFRIENFSPRLHQYMEISLPAKRNLRAVEFNNKGFEFDFSDSLEGHIKIYRWTAKKPPTLVHEPDMEDYQFMGHHLQITTHTSWAEISRFYHRLIKPRLKPNKAIKTQVAKLIEGTKTRREKVSKIFYWTARKIRYLGVDREKDRPGLEPHDVSYTFETRGGVCRDKAALLTAMLRLAGVEADMILIAAGYRLHPEAPVPWFNHAVTVSYDKTGEPEFIMDPTSENTRDFLPKYEEGCSYLIARKKGDTLRETPLSPPSANNSRLDIQLKIDQTGNARGKVKYLLSGIGDTVFRDAFTQLNPYQMKQTMSGLISLLHPHAKLIDFTFPDVEDKTRDISFNATIEIDQYMRIIASSFFLPFDAFKLDMHAIYNHLLSPFNQSKRQYDFKLLAPFSFDTHMEIQADRELKTSSFPNIKKLDFKGFKTSVESHFDQRTLRIHTHFETSRIRFKRGEFEPLKETLSRLGRLNNLYIIGDLGGHND